MLRHIIFSVLLVHVHSAPGHLPTVLSPFTITPSVEILKTPVTKLETVALATPVVQKIESYSTGDSSSTEIRDLLRSLLSEIRGGKTVTTLSTPLATYSSSAVVDSYSAPPRNTVTDYNAPTYPDSKHHHRKPEKIVLVQEKQIAPVVTSFVEPAPVAVKEVVKTVYQPVYVPVQYSPPAQTEYVSVAQPVAQTVAVPTSVKTGASAVAISTIHGSPAYQIQQQQLAVPVVQQQVSVPVVQQQVSVPVVQQVQQVQAVQAVQAYQPVTAYASAAAGTTVVDTAYAYKK